MTQKCSPLGPEPLQDSSMAVIKVCAHFQKINKHMCGDLYIPVFAGSLQRNGRFRTAEGNFVIQCRRHYIVFLQEASSETRLGKGSPVWPFIILKGSDSLYNFRLGAQRPSTLYRAPAPKRDSRTKSAQKTCTGKSIHSFRHT